MTGARQQHSIWGVVYNKGKKVFKRGVPEGGVPAGEHGGDGLLDDEVALLLGALALVGDDGQLQRQAATPRAQQPPLDAQQPAVQAQHRHACRHRMQVHLQRADTPAVNVGGASRL